MKKLIICDIDGTLANCDHRLHFWNKSPKDWKNFKSHAKDDLLIAEVEYVIKAISSCSDSHVVMVTGRSDDMYELTYQWLKTHGFEFEKLYMRKENDFRPDTVVKSELIDQVEEEYGIKAFMAFEDRPRVCEMLRDRGLHYFYVGQTMKDF